MGITGGFGFVTDLTTGKSRKWYMRSDGVRRWASNDKPCDSSDQLGGNAWNPRDTLPKDGTKVRILWSNGKEDVGYFDRLNFGTPWVEEVTKVEHPEIYAEGGEWSTEFGEGDNSEFHPVGWLPLTPNAKLSGPKQRSC